MWMKTIQRKCCALKKRRQKLDVIKNLNLDTIVFDNNFSWARGKQLFYSIEIVPPILASEREVTQEVTRMYEDGVVPWITEESETTRF
ncbi:hypothetical protein PoB_006426000 [Plakobranchus ocellatus]|uniref:Uncharacterized protein n=1 Tax=Plakobranchus ocellatus TaxID=259542 RepID=A0AAV4D147_9GAST|nr:hypothetical protein PoB_006426000 [Plakobranchus ocellatus]